MIAKLPCHTAMMTAASSTSSRKRGFQAFKIKQLQKSHCGRYQGKGVTDNIPKTIFGKFYKNREKILTSNVKIWMLLQAYLLAAGVFSYGLPSGRSTLAAATNR